MGLISGDGPIHVTPLDENCEPCGEPIYVGEGQIVEAEPKGWRRADHGDLPDEDSEIVAIMFPANDPASMIVYARMAVSAVLEHVGGVSVLGAAKADTDGLNRFSLPKRPDDIIGKRAVFWHPYPYVEEEAQDVQE